MCDLQISHPINELDKGNKLPVPLKFLWSRLKNISYSAQRNPSRSMRGWVGNYAMFAQCKLRSGGVSLSLLPVSGRSPSATAVHKYFIMRLPSDANNSTSWQWVLCCEQTASPAAGHECKYNASIILIVITTPAVELLNSLGGVRIFSSRASRDISLVTPAILLQRKLAYTWSCCYQRALTLFSRRVTDWKHERYYEEN